MIIINALTLPRKCNKNVTKVETNLLILCFTNIKRKMKQYFKEVSRDWAIFKCLGDKLSYKSIPNIWSLFCKHRFLSKNSKILYKWGWL